MALMPSCTVCGKVIGDGAIVPRIVSGVAPVWFCSRTCFAEHVAKRED